MTLRPSGSVRSEQDRSWRRPPLVLAPEPVEDPWYAPDAPPPLAPDAPFGDPADPPEPPPPETDTLASVALQLPPLAQAVNFPVEDRGFFAGPKTALQLDLLDRASGQLLWSKAVTADADPVDAKAMAKLLDDAFAGQSWARRSR